MYTKKAIAKDWRRNWKLYLLMLPVFAFYIIFCYKPMYGIIIAFKDFQPGLGIMQSPWIGFENFIEFFTGNYFTRTLSNTLIISISNLVFGFPAPIILALLINEVVHKSFAKTVQTITYMPHFVSLVVVCGLIRTFVAEDGIINYILSLIHI